MPFFEYVNNWKNLDTCCISLIVWTAISEQEVTMFDKIVSPISNNFSTDNGFVVNQEFW